MTEKKIENNVKFICDLAKEYCDLDFDEFFNFKYSFGDLVVYFRTNFGKDLMLKYNQLLDCYELYDYNTKGANSKKQSHHYHLQKRFKTLIQVFMFCSTLHNPNKYRSN